MAAGWWKRWPHANVAIATGPMSGVVVIDVDLPAGKSSLKRLVEEGYRLPETLTVRTGSGGLHLYYASRAASLSNTAGRLPGVEFELPGVDLRAAGGYVVAPPSLHVSGSRYCWIEDEVMLAEAPPWLRASRPSSSGRREAAPFRQYPRSVAWASERASARSPAAWPQVASTHDRELRPNGIQQSDPW